MIRLPDGFFFIHFYILSGSRSSLCPKSLNREYSRKMIVRFGTYEREERNMGVKNCLLFYYYFLILFDAIIFLYLPRSFLDSFCSAFILLLFLLYVAEHRNPWRSEAVEPRQRKDR